MQKIEILRHSTAHILAAAVQELFPNIKLAIGPFIENGFYYDFQKKTPFTPSDLEKIEKKMKEIIKKDEKFTKKSLSNSESKKLLKNEPFKLELLEDLKKDKIKPTFYKTGKFIDLCSGPHVKSTKDIKAFKLMKVSGAYWRGDSTKTQLQRIYGTAFFKEKDLKDYLKLLEEAEKRNHIKLGKQLNLFSTHPEGPGFPFLHPKGMIIWNELIKYLRQEHKEAGYKEVKTPEILSRELWEKSGHWEHFSENMYFTKIDKRDFAIKPMNCPGNILIYRETLHSYREFPLRLAEIGLVHRHELSGVLNGLFRVRAFHQDDAHIYCTEKQIKDEVKNIIKLTEKIYKTFKLGYHIELSTKPEKAMGTKQQWDKAEKALAKALDELKIKYQLNPGDGAFYGPKIDFHLKDSLGRKHQCGTIQLDFQMPEKHKLTYDGEDGQKHRPSILHRTIYGSMERFLGILIEHYAGHFPLWLSPVHVKLLTLTDRNIKYAQKVKKELEENNIRVELDIRTETMGKKVRDAQLERIPLIVTVGDKEQEKNTLAVRGAQTGKVNFGVKISSFIKEIKTQIESKK